MFTFDKVDYDLSFEEIKSRLTEEELFRRYCTNFKRLDTDFLSEFYKDSRASCRIYRKTNGSLAYKDFGSGEHYNCFNYIKRKYNCTFPEMLKIITSDFNLKDNNINKIQYINNSIILTDNKSTYKSRIDIIIQPYNFVDFSYWNKFKINLYLLADYNVFSCSHVFLKKKDKTVTFEYKKDNPIYAYRFTNNGEYNYKIYKPLEQNKRYKWLFSGRAEDIEGYDQLDWLGDTLILTKSLKDCMCYRLLGFNAISLQGEANRFDIELKNRLLKRFKAIVVNYDNDEEGIRGTTRICSQMGFKWFYIDDYKDLSDYMVNHTIEEAKIMIKKKINEC